MIHITDVYTFKAKLNKLKHKLNDEKISESEKQLVNKYLNEVFFLLEELKQ